MTQAQGLESRQAQTAGSFGEGYGPLLVARAGEQSDEHLLAKLRAGDAAVAIPGVNTTAFLVLRLILGQDIRHMSMPFSEVPHAVADGRVAAGLLIHDAQLTYARMGDRQSALATLEQAKRLGEARGDPAIMSQLYRLESQSDRLRAVRA